MDILKRLPMGISLGRPVSPGCRRQEHEGRSAHDGRPERFPGPFLHRRIMKQPSGPVGADVDRYGDENERGAGNVEYFRCFVRFIASQVVLVLVADIPIHPRVGEQRRPRQHRFRASSGSPDPGKNSRSPFFRFRWPVKSPRYPPRCIDGRGGEVTRPVQEGFGGRGSSPWFHSLSAASGVSAS